MLLWRLQISRQCQLWLWCRNEWDCFQSFEAPDLDHSVRQYQDIPQGKIIFYFFKDGSIIFLIRFFSHLGWFFSLLLSLVVKTQRPSLIPKLFLIPIKLTNRIYHDAFIMFFSFEMIQNKWLPGRWNGSTSKMFLAKWEDMNLIPRTYMMNGKSWYYKMFYGFHSCPMTRIPPVRYMLAHDRNKV